MIRVLRVFVAVSAIAASVAIAQQVTGASGAMHVSDLDAAVASGKGGWSAKVTIHVHDSAEQAMPGVTVAGRWTGGAEGTVACLTGRRGSCVVQSPKVAIGSAPITFEVEGMTKSGYTYDAASNHDIDGGSDGTTITVAK